MILKKSFRTLLLTILLTSGIWSFGQNKDSICEQIIRNCEWRTMRYQERTEALEDSIEVQRVRANIKITECNERMTQSNIQSLQFSELYKKEQEYSRTWRIIALSLGAVLTIDLLFR